MDYITTSRHVVTVDDDLVLPGRIYIGKSGYPHIWVNGRAESLHRWLLGLTPHDGLYGDHINGNRYDNRRCNLRIVTAAESAANTVRASALGLRGVYRLPSGRFQAKGSARGKQYGLGAYASAEEAAEVAHQWRVENLPGYVGRRDERSVS